jgi:tRNA (mo5U34)-methyltransferase
MKVAYVGSCFSEQFVNHVLSESELVARYFRINTISLVDDVVVDLRAMGGFSKELSRHINYENRKDFKRNITSTNPDVLVVDFVRDVRCPICKFTNGYLSFPYELMDENDVNRALFLKDATIINFGSQAYAELLVSRLGEFCDFVNSEIPSTTVLLIDFYPTSLYYGSAWTAEQFRNDYIAWTLRLPIMHHLVNLSRKKIYNSKVLRYNGTIFSSDNSQYGPSSIHYAPEVWDEMTLSFDRDSFSFPQFPASDIQKLESTAKHSLLWLSDICKEVDIFSEGLVKNGADILTDIVPILLEHAVHGPSFARKPTVVDAFFAFYWILGRVPENITTLLSHSCERTLSSLRNRLIQSSEFISYIVSSEEIKKTIGATEKSNQICCAKNAVATIEQQGLSAAQEILELNTIDDSPTYPSNTLCPMEQLMQVNEITEKVSQYPWFHSIDLGCGIVTPGRKSPAIHAAESAAFFDPVNMEGATVIDIGAWNGFYSFEAKRRGAKQVLATDHFCWNHKQFRGRETFELARSIVGLDVDTLDVDVTELCPEKVGGTFDVVLFLGVLYHLFDPIDGLRRAASLAREVLIVETQTDLGELDRPAMVMYPGAECDNDASNWWGPNRACVKELLNTMGFVRIDVSATASTRAVFHAWRSMALAR